MNYGYIRVSTVNQDLEIQKEWMLDKGISVENIYEDKKSGKNMARSGLSALKEILKERDCLFVYKLDRLSRDTKSSLELLDYFRQNKITVVFGDIGVMDDSYISDLVFTIFSAVATMERRRIVERTQEGRAYKKKNDPNYKEGRKRKLTTQMVENMVKLYESGESVNNITSLYNVGRTTFYTYLKEYRKNMA